MKLQIGSDGVIAIIGNTFNGYTGTLTIQVTGFENDCTQHSILKFAKSCIRTYCIETKKDLIFFEYSLNRALKNPQKLLKSLRSKLIQASNFERSKFEQEMCDLDQQIDHAFHRAPYECK